MMRRTAATVGRMKTHPVGMVATPLQEVEVATLATEPAADQL